MEQLISDIERYCAVHGIAPQRLLREAINAKWGQWADWKGGKSSPRVDTADRLRDFMRDHPPSPAHAPARDQAPAGLDKKAGAA